MRVLTIYDADYPWDVRIEKMLRVLVAAGHDVMLVARNQKGLQREQRLGGVEIRRLPTAQRLERLASFPAFFNPRWVRAALHAARDFEPDRVLVRDLPLAPLALWIGQHFDRPVIVDMAEPYPEALRSNWQFDALGGLDYLIRSPRLAEVVERWVVRRAKRILVVSPESGERLQRIGASHDRWTLVGNTPDLSLVEQPCRRVALPAALLGRPLLVFSGILVGDRGIDVALRGVQELRDGGKNVGLLVIGEGPARPRFEAEMRAFGLEDRVHFTGWISHRELPSFWRVADVGILPFRRCSHIDTTLANKLFDYMAAGLPILASNAPPMVRILEESGAGVTFRSDDPSDFATRVTSLLADRPHMQTMAERGRLAAHREFNWDRDGARFLAAVERP